MQWSDFARFLTAEHLPDGRAVLTIARVEVEEVHPGLAGVHGQQGKAEQKPVLYFRETKHGLVLSPTNQRTLAELFGDNVESCYGQRVALTVKQMRVGGRQTNPIRLAPAQDVAPKVQPAPTRRDPTPAQTQAAQDAALNTEAVVSRLEGVTPATQPPLAFDEAASPSPSSTPAGPGSADQAPTVLPKPTRAATPPSGAAYATWLQASEHVAWNHKHYRLPGEGDPDRLKMLQVAAALGYPKLTADNLDEVIARLPLYDFAPVVRDGVGPGSTGVEKS